MGVSVLVGVGVYVGTGVVVGMGVCSSVVVGVGVGVLIVIGVSVGNRFGVLVGIGVAVSCGFSSHAAKEAAIEHSRTIHAILWIALLNRSGTLSGFLVQNRSVLVLIPVAVMRYFLGRYGPLPQSCRLSASTLEHVGPSYMVPHLGEGAGDQGKHSMQQRSQGKRPTGLP